MAVFCIYFCNFAPMQCAHVKIYVFTLRQMTQQPIGYNILSSPRSVCKGLVACRDTAWGVLAIEDV